MLKETWKIYREKFLTLTGVATIPVVLFFLGNMALLQKETSDGLFITGIAVYLMACFFLLLATPTLIFSIKEGTSVKESYKKGLKVFLSYLWLYVLTFFIISGGFLFFIVPGFLFSVWFSLVFFVFIFEEKRGFSVLFSSKHLISGNFWRIFWQFLSFGLVIGALVAIVFAVSSVIAFFLIRGDIKGAAQISWPVLEYILPIFTLPFALIYSSLIYKKLAEIKAEVPYQEPRKRSKVKYILIGILATPLVVSGLLFNLMNLISRDELPPNDSVLHLPKTEILEKDNAFYFLFVKDNATIYPPRFKLKNQLYQPEGVITMDDIINGKKWDNNFAEDIIKNNQGSLDDFEKAIQFPVFQSPSMQGVEAIKAEAGMVAGYLSLRKLGEINLIKAVHLFHQGKEKEAFEQAIKTIKFGQMIKDSQGSLVQYIVGAAIKKGGLKNLGMMILKTNLSPGTLKTYIPKLEEFGTNKKGFVMALKANYMSTMSIKEKIIDPAMKGRTIPNDLELGGWKEIKEESGFLGTIISKSSFYYKPNQTKRLYMERMLAQVDNAERDCDEIKQIEQSNFEFRSFDDSVMESARMVFTENIIGKYLFGVAAASSDGFVYKKCEEDFLVAGTQLFLALKAYQAGKGKLPDSLGELVPAYIAEIPKDPFSGGPIKYSKDKKIIYSIGQDRKDSGSDEKENLKFKI